jgi:hypothetical protein
MSVMYPPPHMTYAQEDRARLVVERDALVRQNSSLKGSLSNLEWQLNNCVCFSSAATAVDQFERVREVCEVSE